MEGTNLNDYVGNDQLDNLICNISSTLASYTTYSKSMD